MSKTRCTRASHLGQVGGWLVLVAASVIPAANAEDNPAATAMTIEYRNPVWDGYLADPQVIRTRGEYYAFGTGKESGGKQFPVLHSKDTASTPAATGRRPATAWGSRFPPP